MFEDPSVLRVIAKKSMDVSASDEDQAGMYQVYEEGLEILRRGGQEKYDREQYEKRRRESILGIQRSLGRISEHDPSQDSFDIRYSFAFPSDSHHIEDRHIFFTDVHDQDTVQIDFYLTSNHFKDIFPNLPEGSDSYIDFTSVDRMDDSFIRAADTIQFREGEILIDISKESLDPDNRHRRKAMENSVRVTLPRGFLVKENIQVVSEKVQDIFEKYFHAENFFCVMSEESAERYKEQCYLKHHKTRKIGSDTNLSIEEWIPGTYSVIDKGRSKKYADKYGPYAVFFNLRGAPIFEVVPSLEKMIRSNALFSGIERNRRGLMVNQTTVSEDIRSGGAQSFFTRTVCERGLGEEEKESEIGVTIIFDRSVFDSTNWRASAYDTWGDTEHSAQISPEELLEILSDRHKSGNEQMFRYGIPFSRVKHISFPSEEGREKNIVYLRGRGINVINGQTLEEFFVVCKTRGEIIPFSN